MAALIDRGEYAALAESTYLNQASLGLVPRRSIEAATGFLTDVAQHGNLRLTDAAEAEVLDGVRAAAARLLGCAVESIAVIGGATEGLGQLAGMLATPGGEVVLIRTDFPTVTYPWLAAHERIEMGILWVDDDPSRDLTETVLEAIDERTTVVCVGAVQFATGSRVDVGRVVAAAHAGGAKAVIDVTQLAGAGEVAFDAWGADALVCSGYKWLSAPGGVALLVVTDDLAAQIPVLVGWKGSATPFDLRPAELNLAPDARRFELSTMSYSAASALRVSIDMLHGVGMAAIEAHAADLAALLHDLVEPMGWRPFRSLADPSASPHVVSLRHPSAVASDAQAALASLHGIVTSARSGGLRVSLHLYNDEPDVRALAGALASISSR